MSLFSSGRNFSIKSAWNYSNHWSIIWFHLHFPNSCYFIESDSITESTVSRPPSFILKSGGTRTPADGHFSSLRSGGIWTHQWFWFLRVKVFLRGSRSSPSRCRSRSGSAPACAAPSSPGGPGPRPAGSRWCCGGRRWLWIWPLGCSLSSPRQPRSLLIRRLQLELRAGSGPAAGRSRTSSWRCSCPESWTEPEESETSPPYLCWRAWRAARTPSPPAGTAHSESTQVLCYFITPQRGLLYTPLHLSDSCLYFTDY